MLLGFESLAAGTKTSSSGPSVMSLLAEVVMIFGSDSTEAGAGLWGIELTAGLLCEGEEDVGGVPVVLYGFALASMGDAAFVLDQQAVPKWMIALELHQMLCTWLH